MIKMVIGVQQDQFFHTESCLLVARMKIENVTCKECDFCREFLIRTSQEKKEASIRTSIFEGGA